MERLTRLDRIRHQGNLYGFSMTKVPKGVTLWQCMPRYRKCRASLRCDPILKTIIEHKHRHNHPTPFNYNAADISYQATVEENIAERSKHPPLISVAGTAPNEIVSRCSTNSGNTSGTLYSTEGMPRFAPAIAYPSNCHGDRMSLPQLNLFGTKVYSSETTGNTSNASLIPETSNNGSVSSVCSTELPIIQINRSEIDPVQPQFSGEVEVKTTRIMPLEQSQQAGTSSSSFQGHSDDDVQIIGEVHKVISSHHQTQANVPIASLIPETSNSGSASSFCSTELPIIQRNRSEIVPAQQQFSGAVETKATRNMALEHSQQPASLIPETSNSGSVSSFSSTELPIIQRNRSEIDPVQPQFSGEVETKATRNMALEHLQQPGTGSSSFQGHSTDDVQFVGMIPDGGISWQSQFRKAISSHYANVPVDHPAMTANFPDGTSFSFMGSFICVECDKGRAVCIICRKNTMCRKCCKH